MDFNKVDDKNVAPDEERFSERRVIDSGIYLCTVKMAYMDKSQGGAECVKLELETEKGDIVSDTIWVTNKEGSMYYQPKGSEDKALLPGWRLADRLCLHATGKTFKEIGAEAVPKVLQVYDFNARKVVDKEFQQVLMSLVGKKVLTAIMHIKKNKQVKNPLGKFVNGPQHIEINEIIQFFNPTDGRTTTEIRDGIETPVYATKWTEKWKGKVKDITAPPDKSLSDPEVTAAANPFG